MKTTPAPTWLSGAFSFPTIASPLFGLQFGDYLLKFVQEYYVDSFSRNLHRTRPLVLQTRVFPFPKNGRSNSRSPGLYLRCQKQCEALDCLETNPIDIIVEKVLTSFYNSIAVKFLLTLLCSTIWQITYVNTEPRPNFLFFEKLGIALHRSILWNKGYYEREARHRDRRHVAQKRGLACFMVMESNVNNMDEKGTS